MSEREEYTRDNYPTFGKKYNGERAVISLTSWKARINTVSKTLYSLIKQCPGFHIVLVLSEEEFPKMMDEMPANLKLFVKNNLVEVLWVYKNYKSFKKVLFTMDKYRDVPVISADDDCIYTCNYAEELYQKWTENENSVISNDCPKNTKLIWLRGPNTLYPPDIRLDPEILCKRYFESQYNFIDEDMLFGILYRKLGYKVVDLKRGKFYIFHDDIKPQHLTQKFLFDVRYHKLCKFIDRNIEELIK
jgi:hypothetical protein